MAFITCPERSKRKVDSKVCILKCKLKEDCKEYRQAMPQVDPEIIEDLGKRPNNSHLTLINLPEPTVQNQHALDAFRRVMSIRTNIEVKFLEMGQVLDEMFSNQYHIDLGYKNQKVFCEIALDMKWRTANYLRNIYLWQSVLEIPEKEIAEIGWAKAAQILPVAKTKEAAKKWIEKAREPGMTTQALNTSVRLAQGRITEEEAQKQPEVIHFSIYKEQKEVVDLALDVAQKATGSESKGYLFADVICVSFLADYPLNMETPTKGPIIAKLMGRLEEGFGVKFKGDVIDVPTGEILIEAK